MLSSRKSFFVKAAMRSRLLSLPKTVLNKYGSDKCVITRNLSIRTAPYITKSPGASFEMKQSFPREIGIFSLSLERRFHRKNFLEQPKAKMVAGLGLAGLVIYNFPGTFFTLFFGGLGFFGYKIYKTINLVNNDMEQLFIRAGLDPTGRPRRTNINSSRRGENIFYPGRLSLLETTLVIFKTFMPFLLSVKAGKDVCLAHLRESTIQLIQQHIARNTPEGQRLKSILRVFSSRDVLFWPAHYEDSAIVNRNSKFNIKFIIIHGQDKVEVDAQGHSTNYQDENPEVILTSVTVVSIKTGEQISIPLNTGSPATPRGPIREAEYRELYAFTIPQAASMALIFGLVPSKALLEYR